MQRLKSFRGANSIALKGGSYSLAVSALVLALVIAVNILAGVLPAGATRLDISQSKLYSITSNTKVVVNALQKDVTIYWIVQADEEDSVLSNLLSKYDSLSSHISVVKRNPDVYPTFAQQYAQDTVSNNSLVVVCGDKFRYIPYSDIYLTDVDYTTYSYVYSFDGEGALTSAISYVVSDELPKVYSLTGHGEAALSDTFQTQLEKENMELQEFSLLNEDTIPEDAACVLIYAPETDLSQEEAALLLDYAENGGKLLVFAGPTRSGMLENLYSVLENYGVTTQPGIVIEGDRSHYAFGQPYILLPDLISGDVTEPLISQKYYAIVPIAQGLTLSDTGSAAVTSLMTTSEDAYNKSAGYSLTTYEQEDGDLSGSFTLAVSVETQSDGRIIWVASSAFLEDGYNAYSSGANLDFAMNSLTALAGQSEAVSIRTKSLSYNYLTINESTASTLKLGLIGLIPGLFLIFGIFEAIERRRLDNG